MPLRFFCKMTVVIIHLLSISVFFSFIFVDLSSRDMPKSWFWLACALYLILYYLESNYISIFHFNLVLSHWQNGLWLSQSWANCSCARCSEVFPSILKKKKKVTNEAAEVWCILFIHQSNNREITIPSIAYFKLLLSLEI